MSRLTIASFGLAAALLSAAALAILLWNPKELYDPGFQLSFVSVGSILIFTPVLSSIVPAIKFKKEYAKDL